MYKILKNIIEMDDYSVQKLSKSQPPEPFEWNSVEGTELNVSDCIGGKGKIGIKGNTYQKSRILPEGYTQYDYIESNGHQYIDTGINADSNLRVVLDMAYNNEATGNQSNVGVISRFGESTPYSYQRYHLIISSGKFKLYLGENSNDLATDADTNRHLFDFDIPNRLLKVDSTEVAISQQNFDCKLNFWLFGRNSNISSLIFITPMKLYACKMYYNNVIVRDFIPCKNSNNEIGLYDLVNKTFYSRSGTQDFTAGNEVSIPNPEYPQTIQVVTGNNVIKHIGKNWFNSEIETGDISYQTGNNSSSSNRVRTKDFIPVLPNKTYTLKRYIYSGKQFGLRFYDKNQNYLGFKAAVTSQTITFTTNEYSTADGTFNGEIYFIKFIDLENNLNATYQLELGSTTTDYEQYQGKDFNLNLGTIELCKIDNYQDTIFKNVVGDENYNAELEAGAWYKKKAIEKIQITKDTTIAPTIDTTLPNTNRFTFYNLQPTGNKLKGSEISNILKYANNWSQDWVGFYLGDTNRNLVMRLPKSLPNTWEGLKNYLSNTPMVVYYVLPNTTYTKITDTTLISQLEALNKARWFKGVNHWWTETNNLEPVLKGTYRQAVESEVP